MDYDFENLLALAAIVIKVLDMDKIIQLLQIICNYICTIEIYYFDNDNQ